MAQHQRKHQRRHRRFRFTKLYGVLSALVILAAVIGGCIVFFKVDTIHVEGNERYTADQIVEAAGVRQGDNMYLLNKFKMIDQIKEKLTYVDDVTIRRKLPNTLNITVDEYTVAAAVQDGSFARNPVFLEAIEHARRNHASLHLLAYLTHKSSHGCIDYPLAICEMAKKQGLEEVYFHIIFDGRSTEPGSAPALLAELDSRLDQIGLGRIVDGVGRGVVLDRDKNYDKVKRAYDALTDGLGAWYS